MANTSVSIAVPSANGVGASADVSTLGAFKNLVFTGNLIGSVTIEISNDSNAWSELISLSGPGTIQVVCVARYMRARVGSYIQGTGSLEVGGEEITTNLFSSLNVPSGNGTGTALDVSSYGPFKTFTVGQGSNNWQGVLNIQVSQDGVDYLTVYTVTRSCVCSMELPCNYVRVVQVGYVVGTPPYVAVGALGVAETTSFLTTVEALKGSDFSDGSDGDADLDGVNTVNWATKVGNVYTATRVPFLNSFIGRNGCQLKMNGFHGPYYRYQYLAEDGFVLSDDGNDASGATGGAARGAQTMPATPAGANGGTGVGVNGGAQSGALPSTTNRYVGGAGGTSGTGNAGGSGGAVTSLSATRVPLHGGPSRQSGVALSTAGAAVPGAGSGGGSGGGDGVNSGGGGGAAGGQLHMGGGRTINYGIIRARGGNGGNAPAGNAAGGGGGGGGWVIVETGSYEGNVPDVLGGGGGLGAGTGLVGATGLPGQYIISVPEELDA